MRIYKIFISLLYFKKFYNKLLNIKIKFKIIFLTLLIIKVT